MASPAVVQSAASTWTVSTSSSFTVTLGSSPTAGNTLIAIYGGLIGVPANTITAPTGFNTIIVNNNNLMGNAGLLSGPGTNPLQLSVASRVVQSGDGTTWTFNLSASGSGVSTYGVGAVLIEVSNCGLITANTIGYFTPTGVTSGDAGGLVTAPVTNGDLFINAATIFSNQGSGTTWSQASGTTASLAQLQAIGSTASLFGSLTVWDVAITSTGTGTGGAQAVYVNAGNQHWVEVALDIAPPTPVAAIPTIVQVADSTWTASTSSSFTCTLGSSPTTGNTLVAVYGGVISTTTNTNTVGAPSGFTQLQSVVQASASTNNYTQLGFAYRVVQAGDSATWTFNLAASGSGTSTYGVGAMMFELSHVAAGTPASTITSGSSGIISGLLNGGSESITPATSGDLVLAFAASFCDQSTTSWELSPGVAGFTQLAEAGSTFSLFGSIVAWQLPAQSTSSVTVTPATYIVNSNNQQWVTGLLDIVGAVGVSGLPVKVFQLKQARMRAANW